MAVKWHGNMRRGDHLKMEQIRIEAFDPALAGECLLHRVSELYSEVEREVRPDLPPSPADEYVAHLQKLSKYRSALRWIALNQSEEVIGCSYLGFKLVPEYPTAARIDILVSQSYRRRKIGTALLVPLVEAARTAGRTEFTCTVREDSGGDGFLGSIGTQYQGRSIESHLDVTRVQEQRLHEVFVNYNELHEQYEFQWWENTCPEHLIGELANAKMWLNSAPRGQRREELWSISPEWIREEEAVRLNVGTTWWTMVAIEKETARVAAFTDVLFSSYRPWLAIQQDTAVDLTHRRKGLALYLKANLILKIRNEARNVRVLTTINGSNNTGILQINQRLGFVPKYQFGKWEVDLDQLVGALNRTLLPGKSDFLTNQFDIDEPILGDDRR